MQIRKTCMICHIELAKYSCKLCGTIVCESCYDRPTGLCIRCKQGKTIKQRLK